MIIGISGKAGAGKSTVADFMAKNHGCAVVSLADPLKRAVKEFFGFTDDQLWGASESRNAPDPRYVRMRKGSLGSTVTDWNPEKQLFDTKPSPEEDVYLTPRYALQRLGTEYGRACYDNVWIDYVLRVANEIMVDQRSYSARNGVGSGASGYQPLRVRGVVIPDVRFENEVDAIKRVGGKLLRIKRPDAGLVGDAATHRSEIEQDRIDDDAFDHCIDNTGSLEYLENQTRQVWGWLNHDK